MHDVAKLSATTSMNLLNKVASAYGLLIRGASNLQSAFLLAVRICWGWQFFQSGWGKLKNLDGVTEFFTTLGIPMPHLNAILAASVECFGGLFLLLGLASRLTAIPLIFTMIVAYATAEDDLWKTLHSEPFDEFLTAFFKATPYTFLFASLIILIFGPGKASLDQLIGYLWAKKKAS